MQRFIIVLPFLLFFSLFSFSIYAAPVSPQPPMISIIIDDLGNDHVTDAEVDALPGPVVASVIPHTEDSVWTATTAHQNGKEVIAHIPMQPLEPHYLGEGGLKMGMTQQQFDETLEGDLKTVPYAAGINNHMGSLLTGRAQQMDWVMQALKPTGLFFIDSRTVGRSVAKKEAELDGIPTISRDVFLDNVATTEAVTEQFDELIDIARHHGMAVAIGHPNAATIKVLQEEIPELQKEGIELVPVSELIKDREYARQLIHPFSYKS